MRLGGWLVMLTAMMLFLTFIGLPTTFSAPLETLGITINSSTAQYENADIESSSFWGELFDSSSGIFLILVAGGAIIIGLFARGFHPSLVILPFVILVAGTFIQTFVILIKFVVTFNQSWLTSIVTLIFVSLAVGFTMACADYFRTGT